MEKTHLANTIRELIDSIDENGELPLVKRYALRDLLKQDRWYMLESISAHKVQNIWERQFPSDRFPTELLRIADSSLIEANDAGLLGQMLSESKAALADKLLLGQEYFCAVYAGFASWAAARNVVYGSPIISDASSEIDIDPDEWDASFYASLAWSGGAVWEQVADSDKRKEFWIWFINDALPQALSYAGSLN
ncbi:MAG TPA: Imm5 family immunity protein [Pyrinomonadaceae bacterium]|nr:Imm5 family immunity protein [Pyrinomonadaceae bacterium]